MPPLGSVFSGFLGYPKATGPKSSHQPYTRDPPSIRRDAQAGAEPTVSMIGTMLNYSPARSTREFKGKVCYHAVRKGDADAILVSGP